MAQKDIEQWAKMLQEAEAEDQAYEKACNDSIKDAEDAVNDVELGEEDEVIDPASLGFVDSEDGVAEDDMLDGRVHNGHLDVDEAEKDDEVDLAECGFSEDGKELQEKEAEEDLQEAFHKDDEYASMELEVEGSENFDGDNTSFEDALHAEVPDVMVKKVGIGSGGVLKYRISGFLGDLKEAYAFYLGLYGWNDVVKQGEEPIFNELVVFQDGDTLQEADYREAIAHVFDPIGVKASTANLKANNVCQLSIVKEAVKAEKERRQKLCLKLILRTCLMSSLTILTKHLMPEKQSTMMKLLHTTREFGLQFSRQWASTPLKSTRQWIQKSLRSVGKQAMLQLMQLMDLLVQRLCIVHTTSQTMKLVVLHTQTSHSTQTTIIE